MTDYREIIRLHSLKFSNVAIANSLCCSRNTVSEVLKLAETHSLEWPIPETLTNRDIGHLFYPGRGNNEGRRLPDYEYVYNELAKPGVTLSLLWAEYCAKCEAEHTIPYQHSQFSSINSNNCTKVSRYVFIVLLPEPFCPARYLTK